MEKARIRWNELTVLVVDDSKTARHVICGMLRDMGVTRILEASDGAEAMQFTKTVSDAANLVLCDWDMPNMNGLEFLKQMHAIAPKQCFLMVTTRKDMKSVTEARKAGASGYILKPFALPDLQEKITTLLQKS